MTTEKKFRSSQIFRADGKGVFMEVLNGAFRINKVQINFIQYDITTNKQLKRIDTFLDLDDAMLLCQDILGGRLSALKKMELDKMKETGSKYAKTIYLKQGGIHAVTLQKRNQAREDGKALGREFKITPGSVQPWIFSADQGPGKEMENGLIKMEKSEEVIRVPMTDESIKKFALVLKSHIDGYITQQYAPTGEYGHVNKRENMEDLVRLLDDKSVQAVLAKAVLSGIDEAKNKK